MPNEHRFGEIDRLVLIGGGDTMVHGARHARALGIPTTAILSPRHAGERLLFATETLQQACHREVDKVFLVEDINRWDGFQEPGEQGGRRLALCFGPAWVFSPALRACFQGMVNYNPIPVPRYLGGAHYTWQILNGDRNGGCVLQLITDRLDRGPILDACSFEIEPRARIPAHYIEAYHRAGIVLVERFLAGVREQRPFDTTDFDALEAKRLYLPRLHTASNAFIDWAWSGGEIERFCCAFDAPYIGAGTFIGEVGVRLRDVWFEPSENFHPFLSGLVVRRSEAQVWIAVRDGLLRVAGLYDADGSCAHPLPKEGDRFSTPAATLDHARSFRARYTSRGLAEKSTSEG